MKRRDHRTRGQIDGQRLEALLFVAMLLCLLSIPTTRQKKLGGNSDRWMMFFSSYPPLPLSGVLVTPSCLGVS
ncbi:hypothetical protein EDB89DRAFT_1991649, partial [Lactarius sanguifluus]